MKIQFPDRPAPWYDVDRHTITFPVRVDGRPLACVVAAADLVHRFAGRSAFAPTDALSVYESHKETLRRLAEEVIRGATPSQEVFVIRVWY